MTIERIHACKWLVASFARKWTIVCVKLLMPLAIMLPCKALVAPWPMALEWLLLVVRPYMTYQRLYQ